MARKRGFIGRQLVRVRRLLLMSILAAVMLSVGLVSAFRWIDPPWSTVMLQRLADEGGPQHQHWVPLDAIDLELALAVVAAEDQRFPQHWGFDTHEIVTSIENHLDGKPLRGASTISQQVARNLFLWQGRSWLRKGLEVWFTGLIEALWSKYRILEIYLNFAEMGERTFGVGAASERFFGRPPDELGRQRAALLAAVLPNPRLMRVEKPSDYVRQRRDWIVGQMRNLGGTAYLDGVLAAR